MNLSEKGAVSLQLGRVLNAERKQL